MPNIAVVRRNASRSYGVHISALLNWGDPQFPYVLSVCLKSAAAEMFNLSIMWLEAEDGVAIPSRIVCT